MYLFYNFLYWFIIDLFPASCELGTKTSERDMLGRVQETMSECLVECWSNGHKHVTHLPVSDFFIYGSDHWLMSVQPMTKSLTGKWVTCLCPFNQHSTKHSTMVSCTRLNVSPSHENQSSLHEAGNKSIINQ